ncbi:MAG: hypothetical protein KGH75_04485 [Rhodospirillales bacterium]|nr:hypothetical protein [Rhodospirillales bacterium]
MAADKTAEQVLAEQGFEPLTAKTTMRSTPSFRARMEQAAAECAMSVSDWLRAVATSALELHEEREQRIAAGYDPDTAEPIDDLVAVAEDPEPEPTPEDLDDYAARVDAAAAALRAETPPPPPPPVAHIDPRECVHPLGRRSGPRCNACGSLIGQVRTVSTTGRYVGRRM